MTPLRPTNFRLEEELLEALQSIKERDGIPVAEQDRRDLLTDVSRIKGIPALLIAGGADRTAAVDDAREFWRQGRVAGAPWTFVIEPIAPHSSPEIHAKTLQSLTVPWIAGVLRQRIAADGTLRPVANLQAWVADETLKTIRPHGTTERGGVSCYPMKRLPKVGWQLRWLGDEGASPLAYVCRSTKNRREWIAKNTNDYPS